MNSLALIANLNDPAPSSLKPAFFFQSTVHRLVRDLDPGHSIYYI